MAANPNSRKLLNQHLDKVLIRRPVREVPVPPPSTRGNYSYPGGCIETGTNRSTTNKGVAARVMVSASTAPLLAP